MSGFADVVEPAVRRVVEVCEDQCGRGRLAASPQLNQQPRMYPRAMRSSVEQESPRELNRLSDDQGEQVERERVAARRSRTSDRGMIALSLNQPAHAKPPPYNNRLLEAGDEFRGQIGTRRRK